jgi:hypothetical protein
LGSDQVGQRRAGAGESGFQILTHQSHLRAHVPRPDDRPLHVSSEQPRHEDQPAGDDSDDGGLENMAADHSFRQSCGKYVLSLDH